LFKKASAATIRRMRWLLHGPLMPAVGDALRRHGQEPSSNADASLAADEVLESARRQQLEIMTADTALANALFASARPFNRLIVYLNVEPGEVEQDDAVDRLFKRYPRLTAGRLYTVTASRVKVRQLPTAMRALKA
jgi:predicted nuclease of predicted toxin-antitoxin system